MTGRTWQPHSPLDQRVPSGAPPYVTRLAPT